MTTVADGRANPLCRTCGQLGHRTGSPRCLVAIAVAEEQDVDEVIAAAAVVRERIDAMEEEIRQYTEVRAELERRIIQSRAEILHMRTRLNELRRVS